MRNNYHKQSGFTLVEILIALVIFAIMGVLAAMSLHAIIRTHQQLKTANKQLLQLQITMTMLRRDIVQVVNRPVQDANGNLDAAFYCGGDSMITFTRAGLSNPFGMNRQSNMQRIGYELLGDNLVRLTWNTLDQAPHEAPEKQVLLSNVASIQWQFIAGNGAKSSNWPSSEMVSKQQDDEPSVLPKVVLMVLTLKNKETLSGVFPIPSRGVNAQATS